MKKIYEVIADGFLLGDHYRKGDLAELYPAQAAQDLPPHGTMLRDPDAAAPPPIPSPAPAAGAPSGSRRKFNAGTE